MIIGTTASGFEYSIEDEVMKDWEIIDYMSEMVENPFVIPKILKKMLGIKQYAKLMNHCRTGLIVDSEKMMVEFNDILSHGELKN